MSLQERERQIPHMTIVMNLFHFSQKTYSEFVFIT